MRNDHDQTREPNEVVPWEQRLQEVSWMAVSVVLALMLGTTTARPWIVFVGHGLLLLLSLTAFALSLRAGRSIAFPGFAWLFFGMGAFSLLQTVPLPPSLLAWISPRTDAIYHAVLDGYGLYGQGQWKAVSQDTAATLGQAARWFVLGLVFLFGGSLFSRSGALRRLGLFLGLMVLGFAALGFVQKVLGTDKILFVIPFDFTPPFFFSTFINPNNLVGFLLLGAFVLLAQALHHPALSPRLFWLLAFAVTGTAALASLSLGGLLSMTLGAMAYLVWSLVRPSDRHPPDRRVVPASFAFLLFGAYMAWEPFIRKVSERLSISDEARLSIWRDAWALIADHPLWGVGGGVFAYVFPRYQSEVFPGRVVHPENLPVQLASEYGLPAAIVLILLTLAALLFLFVRSKSATARALTVTACMVPFANLFDFSLNQLSVAAPFVLILGALLLQDRRTNGKTHGLAAFLFAPKAMPLRLAAPLVGLAVGVGIIGSLLAARHFPSDDQRRMYRLVYDRTLSDEAFREEAFDLLTRHPVDGWLHLIAGERYPAGDRASLAPKVLHLKKAALLMPFDAGVERSLGRAYALVGMAEPAIEAHRRAMEKTWAKHAVRDIFTDMLGYRLNEAALVEATPPQSYQELTRFLFQRRSEKPLYDLLSRWTSQDEDSIVQRDVWAVRLRLRDNKPDEALALADDIVRRYPTRYEGMVWRGHCHRNLGDDDAAYQALSQAAESGAPLSGIWGRLVTLALKRDDPGAARDWINRYFRTAAATLSVRLDVMLAFASIYEHQGDYPAARYELNRAARLAPADLRPLERLGDVSLRQELGEEAVTAYDKALALPEGSLKANDKRRIEGKRTKAERLRHMQEQREREREQEREKKREKVETVSSPPRPPSP